jgi:hypothetical protein
MKTILISVLILFSSLAHAQVKLYRLPVGTRLILPEGTYQGYSLEEMKIILKMDVDLSVYEPEIVKYKSIISSLEAKDLAKDQIIVSKDKQIKILTDDRARIFNKWSDENKARHVCENKPAFGSWIAWGSAGVATITAVVLGVVLSTK